MIINKSYYIIIALNLNILVNKVIPALHHHQNAHDLVFNKEIF